MDHGLKHRDHGVAAFKAKTDPIEAEWIKEAEAKGLKNAAAVLKEFRAEIASLQ